MLIKFICNITGHDVCLTLEERNIGREGVTYKNQNSRFRSIIYLIALELFGDIIPLIDFPLMKDIKCMGMSDNNFLASSLGNKFDYVNTFYHTEPYLNIYDCNDYFDKYDIIISSDVFEHINPYPGLDIAFKNLYKMLKPDGFVIFSVPFNYENQTLEHFPNLYNYKIVEEENKYILYNETINGTTEIFDNLVFHGGPGSTLEMRVFCYDDLISRFHKAGFSSIKVIDLENPDLKKYGILWENKCSLTMLIKK